jgi:hypothetical protein
VSVTGQQRLWLTRPRATFASTKESLNSRQNISDEKLKSRYESNPVKVR